MAPLRVIAMLLIVGGVLALAYGGFTYTEETHEADIGPIELSVKDRERVNVPMWVGVAAVGAGAMLLVAPVKS